MKRLLYLMMALIVVLSAVAACAAPADSNRDTGNANEPAADIAGNGAGSDDGTDSPAEEETTADETETESAPDTETDPPPHEDAFTVENLDGYEFRIASYVPISNNMASCVNDFDEPSEEVYANAVYQRNLQVEKLLNVTISETTYNSSQTLYNDLRTFSNAGSHDYDLCFMSMEKSVTAAKWGFLSNVDDFDGIDLGNSWWNEDCTEQLAIHGKRALLSGDISVSDKEALWAVYFNKELIGSLGLENPYDLVASGEWTWDKMMEMSLSAFSADNGTAGVVTTNENIVAGWASAGQKLVSLDETGKASLSCGNDEFYGILTALREMMSNDSVFTILKTGTEDILAVDVTDHFNEGTALFAANPISMVNNMRSQDTPFGILPTPKYSLETADYASHVTSYSSVAMIPTTGYDFSYEIGIIAEALAAKGAEIITPAYYDILLTSESGRDEESAPMLDIIFEHRSYDIGIYMNFEGLYRAFIQEKDLSPEQILNSRKKAIDHELEENW